MKIAAFIFILGDAFALGFMLSQKLNKKEVSLFGTVCSILGIILLTPYLF